MAAAESNSVMVQQLSRQLHAISEIAESLTLRLLALEERFEQFQQYSLADASDSEPDEASRQLLDDSGDRLRHLQGLLEEDAPRAVMELVTSTDDEVEAASDAEAPSSGDDEPGQSLNETVYVDDPQIDPASDEIDHQQEDDQIDLLSA